MQLTDMEYEWLTGWKGPPGAAFNQIYEYLRGAGLITFDGDINHYGELAVEQYEERLKSPENKDVSTGDGSTLGGGLGGGQPPRQSDDDLLPLPSEPRDEGEAQLYFFWGIQDVVE
jgi:hypothetical protein